MKVRICPRINDIIFSLFHKLIFGHPNTKAFHDLNLIFFVTTISGTNTYEKWEMKIYKRVIDLVCSSADIKEITSMKIDSGVEIELTLRTEDDE